jgi:antitoxin (DNA-binding transcriptional repressor) of toxin-antitoxin stability system
LNKSSPFSLVEAIEQGRECEIVIACNGRPDARLLPINVQFRGSTSVLPKAFEVPGTINPHGDEVARLFLGRMQS